ncbi:MAG TPA: hypothetical protein VI306_17230 [Pyrinomonadaceae bacterium]
MKLSRRTFSRQMLGSFMTLTLVKNLSHLEVLGNPVKPVVRKWLIEMESVTQQLRKGEVQKVEWQNQIETLMSRVDMKELLTAIDFDKLAKRAIFPKDHESADDVDFSHSRGLPDELSFSPYFYAMKKGTAIVPHAHTNMTSMHMMLKGQTQCRQFERVSDESNYLTIKPTTDKLLDVGAVSTMSDEQNNVHWFKALSGPVFMFNIGVFHLNPAQAVNGRDYIDPLGGEKLSNGLIRARRIEVKQAYKLYGRS